MIEGHIQKALSGFYYVDTGTELLTCRARGKFRKEGVSPLVGDRVSVRELGGGEGFVEAILPRRNAFSRPAVANAIRLLMLPEEVQEKLAAGTLTAGHARAILTLKTEKQQREAAQKISALGLSVRQAELLCRNMSREPKPEKELPPLKVDYVAECEKNLSKHLGRGVKIVNGKRKGRFELEFYGPEDLQRLLDALMKIK